MGLLENILGSVKDTASISKATILSNPTNTNRKALFLRLAVLRATTHHPSSPPSTRHLASILSVGNSSSRATASAAIDALMSRLHQTRSAAVALKCLFLLHSIVRRGSFILHDQLSFFPVAAGRRSNHLNLSAFRDCSSPASWHLSTWVRWYARYLEQILTTSHVLGHFLFSLSSRLDKEKAVENLPSLLNTDLLREIHSLVDILEEIARSPENFNPNGENQLVSQLTLLVAEDYSMVVKDLESRIGEFTQRLSCMSFADSVELLCELKRLEDCRERLLELLPVTVNAPVAALWELKGRLRADVVTVSNKLEEIAVLSWRRVGKTGSSDRFGERVESVARGNSVSFSSNRFTFRC